MEIPSVPSPGQSISETPESVSQLATEVLEWVEDANGLLHEPVVLLVSLDEPRMRGALQYLHALHTSSSDRSGAPRPLIIPAHPFDVQDPRTLLRLAAELSSFGQAEFVTQPTERPSVAYPILQLMWDLASLGLSLAGYGDMSNVLSGGSAAKSFGAMAKALRKTQSAYELPLVNEAFLRHQIAVMLIRIGVATPIVMLIEGGTNGVASDWQMSLIRQAMSASAPITFVYGASPSSLETTEFTKVRIEQLQLQPIPLSESELVHRWIGNISERNRMWSDLQSTEDAPDETSDHALYFQILEQYLQTDFRVVSDEELKLLFPDEWTAVIDVMRSRSLQLAPGAYQLPAKLAGEATRDESYAGRLIEAATAAAASRGSLAAATLEHMGAALAELGRESTDSGLRTIARRMVWDLIDELWLRHRVEAVAKILERSGINSGSNDDLNPHERAIVEVIGASSKSHGEMSPVQEFVAAAKVLATATSSRAQLLGVAEQCAGLLPEIAHLLPQQFIDETALEIASVFCGSGEGYRIEHLTAAWRDYGTVLGSLTQSLITKMMLSQEGTYSAFSRRITNLTRRLTIVRSTEYLSYLQIEMLSELSYMCWYLGRFADAVGFSQARRETCRELLGLAHPETFQADLSYAISLWNVDDREGAAKVIAESWSRAETRVLDADSRWHLRLRRYAVADFCRADVSAAELVELREPILGQMFLKLGPTDREYIRCLHNQGHDQIAAGDVLAGFARVEDALQNAITSLGEFDHDTIEYSVQTWAFRMKSPNAETIEEFNAYLERVSQELGQGHPVVAQLMKQRQSQ